MGGGPGDADDRLDGACVGLRRSAGLSRIPYASARAGHFFKIFAATHPTEHFPHRSLLLISGLAIVACLFDLGTVIAALLTSRILVQFVGQIATVFYLRATGKRPKQTYRMPLFPLPALFALSGWLFVFFTSERPVLIYGVTSLLAGVTAFLVWDRIAPKTLTPAAEALAEDFPGRMTKYSLVSLLSSVFPVVRVI